MDAVKYLTIHRMALQTKNYLAPNVSIAEMEKPWEADPRRELRNLGRMFFPDPLLSIEYLTDPGGACQLIKEDLYFGNQTTGKQQ